MGTNEYSQPASKSSWDSQDFGDVNMVVKMAHFHKSSRPQWVKDLIFRFFKIQLSYNFEGVNCLHLNKLMHYRCRLKLIHTNVIIFSYRVHNKIGCYEINEIYCFIDRNIISNFKCVQVFRIEPVWLQLDSYNTKCSPLLPIS